MTPDIERLAREAGLEGDYIAPKDSLAWEALERFAALVRARALEEAAKVCDLHAEGGIGGWKHNTPAECAAAIRALKG